VEQGIHFVRFVTAAIGEESCRRTGVFQAAGELARSGTLPAADLEELLELRRWFNDHLEAPPRFSRSRRKSAARRAICWFKSTATAHLTRIHAICRILNEHGVPTEKLTCARPGYVVFEDEHQVAAVPFAETAT
jgi:hypothetical protein